MAGGGGGGPPLKWFRWIAQRIPCNIFLVEPKQKMKNRKGNAFVVCLRCILLMRQMLDEIGWLAI